MNDICKIPLQHNGLTEQQLDAMDQLEAIHAYQEKQCKCHRARAWQKIVGEYKCQEARWHRALV